jgi:hypothetical protein
MISSSSTSTAPTRRVGDRPARSLEGVRKTVAGVGLLGAAVTGLVSALVGADEGTSTSAADLYAIAARSSAALTASAMVFAASAVLMIPALSGMLQQLRGRGATLGAIGAGFWVLGAFGHLGYAIWELMIARVPHQPDRPAMIAYLVRASMVTAVLLPLLLSVVVGLLLLVTALWRAGRVPLWVLVLVVAGIAFELGAETLNWQSKIVPVVSWGCAAVVFGYIGARVLTMPRGEWESHGPGELSAEA